MVVLLAGTRNASGLLGVDAVAGTLEEGKFADFLVLNDNPLNNLHTLLAPEQVYKAGMPIKIKP